jgi:hypothetical protein
MTIAATAVQASVDFFLGLGASQAKTNRRKFQAEVTALHTDTAKALFDIRHRHKIGTIRTSDYYFLVCMARKSVADTQGHVDHALIRAALELVLDLWSLCDSNTKTAHAHYVFAKTNGLRLGHDDPTVEAHIRHYIEATKAEPLAGALENILRIPEAILRDDLLAIPHQVITKKIGRHLDDLYRMIEL